MTLYLMRHAEALSMSQAGVGSDEDRPLSARGIDAASRAGRAMKGAGLQADRMLISPLLRARQTAEQVAAELGCADRIEVCRALQPGCVPEQFFEALREHHEAGVVIAVGHQPLLGEIAYQMASGKGGQAPSIQPAEIVRAQLVDFPRSTRAVVLARWDPERIRNTAA